MLFSNTSVLPYKSSFTQEAIPDPVVESENLSLDGNLIVFQTMVESFCATYQSICCNDVTIVQEGIKDFAKTVVEFFMNLAKRIGAYVKNFFNYIMSFFMDFEKFIDEYKDNIDKFEEFEVSGYDYTIDSDKIMATGIEKIISGYNANIDKIKTLKDEDVKNMVRDSLSKDELGKLRGEIVGTGGYVKPERFTELMKNKYRGNKTSTHRITVDSSVVSEYIEKFKDFKSLLEDVKEDGYKINSAFESMATFFKDSPYYVYDSSGDKEIQTHHIDGDDSGNFHTTGGSKNEKYSDDYYKNLNMYCNFCFRMCKSYATIYKTAYTIKTESIKEALEFYKTTIRKALNPMADKKKDDEESNSKSSSKESFNINESNLAEQNYISQFNGMMESLEFDYYFENYESYVNELENLGKWWNNGVILLEDVELKDRPMDKDVGFFKKFIEFIKTLFTKFVDTAKNLFTSNEEWFSKYASKLDEIPIEALEHLNVTLFKYEADENYKNFETTELKIKINLSNLYSSSDYLKKQIGDEKKEKNDTYIAKKMYPNVMKLSSDISDAVKIFFRGKVNKLETYSGSAIKPHIDLMRKYCESYTEKINDVKEIVDDLTQEMEKIDEEYERVKESSITYSMLEKDNIESTAYAWLPWYDSKMDDIKFPLYEHTVIVMEEDSQEDEKTKNERQFNENESKKIQDQINAKKKQKEQNIKKINEIDKSNKTEAEKKTDKEPFEKSNEKLDKEIAELEKKKTKYDGKASNPNAQGVTSSETDSRTDEEKQKDEEEKKAEQTKRTAMMQLLKRYYKIRISVFTAILSIIEERYVNYVKTLRGIVSMSGLAKDRAKEQGVKTKK